jgi:hypothetical protein
LLEGAENNPPSGHPDSPGHENGFTETALSSFKANKIEQIKILK